MTAEPRAPVLRFHLSDGSVQEVVASGSVYTVMHAAKRAGVPGIEGQCGGFRACATCHVHVGEAWMQVVGPPGQDERELLEMTEDFRPESRLSCQIRISQAIDGIDLTPAI